MMNFLHWISGTFTGEVILYLQIVRCYIVFSLATRNLKSLRYMIFEKFGESSTRKITTYVKCDLKLRPFSDPEPRVGLSNNSQITPSFLPFTRFDS